MSEKISKEDANYSIGMMARHCGPLISDDHNYCKHFEVKFRDKPYKQGSCTKVAGEIMHNMWCRLFKKAEA